MDKEFKDYYKILGVSKEATTDEIRKAYRNLAKELHPDKYMATEKEETIKKCEKLLTEVNEAYATLKNEKDRLEYNFKYENYQASLKQKKDQTRKSHYEEKAQSTRRNHNTNSRTYYQSYQEEFTEEASEETALEYLRRLYKEIRKEELRKASFSRRHQAINRKYQLNSDLDGFEKIVAHSLKGVIHISSELIFQLKKLKIRRNDNIPRFVLRNRKLIAAGLTAAIIWGPLGNIGENNTFSNSIPNQVIVKDATDNNYQDDSYAYEALNFLTKYHTVKAGDTVSQLAVDSNSSEQSIVDNNNLKSKNSIYFGDTLKITYQVTNKDLAYYTSVIEVNNRSLAEIAEQYETDVETLYRLNKESVEVINDEYYSYSDKIVVPNFRTKEEVRNLKENVKILTRQ